MDAPSKEPSSRRAARANATKRMRAMAMADEEYDEAAGIADHEPSRGGKDSASAAGASAHASASSSIVVVPKDDFPVVSNKRRMLLSSHLLSSHATTQPHVAEDMMMVSSFYVASSFEPEEESALVYQKKLAALTSFASSYSDLHSYYAALVKRACSQYSSTDIAGELDHARFLKKSQTRWSQYRHRTMFQLYFGAHPAPMQLKDCFPAVANPESIDLPFPFKIPAAYPASAFTSDFAVLQAKTAEYIDARFPANLAEFTARAERQQNILRSDIHNIRQRQLDERAHEARSLWFSVVHREMPVAHKVMTARQMNSVASAKKIAAACKKELSKKATNTRRLAKDAPSRARRIAKELLFSWRRNEKTLAEQRRRMEKEAADRLKKEDEEREQVRNSRKLNFLLRQTEIFSHFMASKMGVDQEHPEDGSASSAVESKAEDDGKPLEQVEDEEEARAEAQRLIDSHMTSKGLSGAASANVSESDILSDFKGQLKAYQVRGVQWLVSLYDQGINGILADEMGLGKTIQTISFLNYLATRRSMWGPFLIIAPTATLHNWQQELSRFCPALRVIPYWGPARDRKLLRRAFTDSRIGTRNSPFHAVISSYKIVVDDEKVLSKIGFQYLVLDEAHAIKSAASQRWQTLLRFPARNRLLLTGTPIQNNMAELWALLHFIMPALFESHDEFASWFSRDIESNAAKNTKIRPDQVEKLHKILRPFMLRRVKKDVEQEMAAKVEVNLPCAFSSSQKDMYDYIKSRILQKRAALGSVAAQKDSDLMNMVMQLRKVCNHPALFEHSQQQVQSPLFIDRLDGLEMHVPRLLVLELGPNFCPWDAHFRQPSRCIQIELFSMFASLSRFFISRDLATLASRTPLPASSFAFSPSHNAFSLDVCETAESLLRPTWFESIPHEFMSSITMWTSAAQSACELLTAPDDQLWRIVRPRVIAPALQVIASDRRFTVQRDAAYFIAFKTFVSGGLTIKTSSAVTKPLQPKRSPEEYRDPFAISRLVSFPSLRRVIVGSGKMLVLDRLLARLHKEGHRALIFCQMTRMLDILEEYLHQRRYSYVRMDGSTPVAERRDRVHDFQTRDDIFLFMLSTRAGGLGITLTAADTVIFYDHDWNPTSDEQATDRAHRIGQTKQVTVYRLVAKGSIEERIILRARQKRSIQRAVYEAGGAATAAAAASEVPSSTKKNDNREMLEFLLGDVDVEKEMAAMEELAEGTSVNVFGGNEESGDKDKEELKVEKRDRELENGMDDGHTASEEPEAKRPRTSEADLSVAVAM